MTDEDELELARAAWRILAAHGGLLDRGEIARRYNLSRQRAHDITGQRHFPKPVAQIGRTAVWLAAEVDHYRSQPPRTGRPRKQPKDQQP